MYVIVDVLVYASSDIKHTLPGRLMVSRTKYTSVYLSKAEREIQISPTDYVLVYPQHCTSTLKENVRPSR